MREFKVGDRVVVGVEADDLMCRPEPLAGKRGTVVSACKDNVNVEMDEPFGDFAAKSYWGFAPEELMLLVDFSELHSDPINHPSHYAGSNGIECIDAMRATLTADEFRGYCKGAAFKYIWRERQKGGNESLAKAVWYLNEAQK